MAYAGTKLVFVAGALDWGGREAEVPDYAFECLYKDKPAYETSEGYVTYDLHEEAIYRLVGLIETHSV